MANAEHPLENEISRSIAQRLHGLRWWIRAYVSWEGFMAVLVWLGAAFWITLVVDWFFEPSRQVRLFLWAGVAAVFLGIVVQQILRRVLVRFTDANLAMVLERRFPELNETLLTTVEIATRPERARRFNPQMLAHTSQEAHIRLQPLRFREVFDFRPLLKVTCAAALLIVSIVLWSVVYPEAFSVWYERMIGLSDRLWPRRTVLLVEGFEQPVKVGRGGDCEVVARVDLEKSEVIPSAIYIRARTEDGARIRATMNRIGNAQPGQDRYQDYSYTFQGLLSDVRFDLHGGDAWIEGLQIDVVDNPTIGRMELEYEYPAYMARGRRTVEVTGVMPVPQGTQLTIRATSNKDLQTVQIHSVLEPTRPPVILSFDNTWPNRQQFQYTIASLEQDTALLFTLLDTDGIRSREPIRLSLTAVADEKPQLEVRLRGIGQAITPQARIPAVGRLTDDYGLARIWWEYTIQASQAKPSQPETAAAPEKSPPEPKPAEADKAPPAEQSDQILIASFENPPSEHPLDVALEASELDVQPGQKLTLAIKAADRYDRAGGPNVGSSDRWMLDVVTADQLRVMLESRELVLRQRFEVIIRELEETRELLVRMEFPSSPPAPKEGAQSKPEPGDSKPKSEPGDTKPKPEPGDSKPKSEPGDSKPKSESGDTKSKPEPEDTKPKPGSGDTKPKPEPEDSKPKSEPGDTKPKPEPGDTKPKSEPGDSKPKSEPEDTKLQSEPTGGADAVSFLAETPEADHPESLKPEPAKTAPSGLEPGEESEKPSDRSPEQIRNRALLAAQRTAQNTIKNRYEILGIADAFDEIREELINNRIDSEKLRRRLKDGIADPLRRVAQESFPRLEQRLHELEATLDHVHDGPRNRLLATQQVDAILIELQEILHQMIELETFNEAVAALRAIIESQEKLRQETQQYHKERLRKLLEE